MNSDLRVVLAVLTKACRILNLGQHKRVHPMIELTPPQSKVQSWVHQELKVVGKAISKEGRDL
jgi:hypothetical protein